MSLCIVNPNVVLNLKQKYNTRIWEGYFCIILFQLQTVHFNNSKKEGDLIKSSQKNNKHVLVIVPAKLPKVLGPARIKGIAVFRRVTAVLAPRDSFQQTSGAERSRSAFLCTAMATITGNGQQPFGEGFYPSYKQCFASFWKLGPTSGKGNQLHPTMSQQNLVPNCVPIRRVIACVPVHVGVDNLVHTPRCISTASRQTLPSHFFQVFNLFLLTRELFASALVFVYFC